MDSCKAKLCCSLRWISGMLRDSSSYSSSTLQLLSSPYNRDGLLNHQVMSILTEPSLYLTLFAIIHPEENLERGEDFSSLLHSLARRGVYVMEDEARAVNHSVLAQSDPFREKSHLAVIDGLMTLYTKSVVTVQHVVKAVKRIGTFVASKDLPDGVNEGLLLWLNKVSEAVVQAEINERKKAMQVSDARQRRRNRLQLIGVGELCIHHVDNICVAVREGQCLGALLVHYVPQSFKWADFHFSKQPLSKQEAEENISKAIEFSNRHLPSPGFHMERETLLNSKVVPLYEANILSILALFFNNFETKGLCIVQENANINSTSEATSSQLLGKNPKSPEPSCSLRGSTRYIQQRSVPNVMSIKKQRSLDSGDFLIAAPKKVPKTRLTARDAKCGKAHSLSSHSESALDSTIKLSDNFSQQPLARTNVSTSRNATNYAPANVTVFKAPVRDSVSIKQAKTLSRFSTQRLNPSSSRRLTYTQSSSSSHISQPDIVPSQASPDRLITASTENLHLRERMRREGQKQCRVSLIRGTRDSRKLAPQSNCSSGTNSASDLHTTSTSRLADVSANCTESWGAKQTHVACQIEPQMNDDHSSSHDRVELVKLISGFKDNPLEVLPSLTHDKGEWCLDQPLLKPAQDTRTISREESEVAHHCQKYGEETSDSELRRSHTIDKPHTFASASAAGLPIVKSCEEHHTNETSKRVQAVGYDTLAHKTTNIPTISQEDNCKELSQGSLANSGHVVIHLDIFPAHALPLKCQPNEMSSSVSPEILELRKKAHTKSEEILAHLLATKKQEQIMKQRIAQILLSDPNLLPKQEHEVNASPSVPSSSLSCSTSHPSPPEQLETGKQSTMDVAENEPRGANTDHPRTPQTYSNQNQTKPNCQLQTLPNAQRAKFSSHVDKENDGEVTPPLHMSYTSTTKKPKQPVAGSLAEIPFSPIAYSQPGHPHSEYRYLATPIPQPLVTQTQLPDSATHETRTESHNPWLQAPLDPFTKTKVDKEDALKQREQKVKSKLEERERDRKAAWEDRKKPQVNNRPLHELSHPGQKTSVPLSILQVGVDSKVLHYRLTNQQPLPSANKEEMSQGSSTSLPATTRLSLEYLSHNGPRCYVKPQVKSNKKLIKNALCYVSLAGEANLPLRQQALAELESTLSQHVLVLFRDTIGFKFRGLYSSTADHFDQVTKIFGSGPKIIKNRMVSHIYKYNSGLKEFKEIHSRAISISVDALTIQNEYWKSKIPRGAHW